MFNAFQDHDIVSVFFIFTLIESFTKFRYSHWTSIEFKAI